MTQSEQAKQDAEYLAAIAARRGPGYLEQFRQKIPGTIGQMAQIVVDNPGQFALITAGTMVAAQMAVNLMKPRTPGQALALFIVLQVTLPKLAWAAVEKGWITFRVRDCDGQLVALMTGEAKNAAATPA